MIGAVLWEGLKDAYTDAGLYTGQIEETGDKFEYAIYFHDYMTVLFLSALIIGIGLTSYRLNTSPAFFIISIIFAAFLGFVSYFFNYLFSQIVSNAIFTTVVGLFPITMVVCTNLHWIALATFAVGSITLYVKKPDERLIQ